MENKENNKDNKKYDHDKPLIKLGDIYDLRKMCKEKGFKLGEDRKKT